MVPPHAYLICIGRTGTGTDLVYGAYRRDLARAIKLGGIAPPVATVGRAHAKTKTSDEYMFGCSCHLWGSQ